MDLYKVTRVDNSKRHSYCVIEADTEDDAHAMSFDVEQVYTGITTGAEVYVEEVDQDAYDEYMRRIHSCRTP